jgi:hypothetical protein
MLPPQLMTHTPVAWDYVRRPLHLHAHADFVRHHVMTSRRSFTTAGSVGLPSLALSKVALAKFLTKGASTSKTSLVHHFRRSIWKARCTKCVSAKMGGIPGSAERVSLAYTPGSRWHNRAEFVTGRAEIVPLLTRKWRRELDYRLIKEL